MFCWRLDDDDIGSGCWLNDDWFSWFGRNSSATNEEVETCDRDEYWFLWVRLVTSRRDDEYDEPFEDEDNSQQRIACGRLILLILMLFQLDLVRTMWDIHDGAKYAL